LTVTGGTLVAYGMVGDTLVEAGTTVPESMGVMAWSTDGNMTAAATGDWLFLHWLTVDAWYWEWWVDGEIYATWIATDGSSTFPNTAPDQIQEWTPLGSTAATGTFSLMFDNNLQAESKMTEAAGDLLPAAPGRSTAVAGGNLSPSAPGGIVA
jgi:squalene cyclase